jgi:hypothetical protein
MSTMALQMPCSYVDIDRDEMEYVDGGYLGNHWYNARWFVSNCINTVITLIIGGGLGKLSGYLTSKAKSYGKQAAAVMFSNTLKNKLTAVGVSYAVASFACTAVNAVFNVLMWAADPGAAIFDYVDARDCAKNNGYLNF